MRSPFAARSALHRRHVALACAVVSGLLTGCSTPLIAPDAETAHYKRVATYDAEILRDPYGVPHIYGARDVDCAFGLGFAHAEDDYDTLEKVVLLGRGERARHFGKDEAVTDYLVRLFRVRELVDERYAADLSPQARGMAEAWADGVTQWALTHPEEVREGVLPFTGKDVVLGFVLKSPFFFGMEGVLKEIFAEERGRSVASIGSLPPQAGSNAFAVAPGRSDDGWTRLVVNSHQPWEGDVAWYETRLVSKEGLDVTGGTFPGAPLVLHGHNRDLGWAFTVNWPDLIDVYVLEMHPDQEDHYRFGDEWLPLEKGTASIEVKLLGPISWTFDEDLFWSKHGPVFKRPHGTYAVRFAGMEEVRGLEQWYRLNKASNLEAWRDAMRLQAVSSLNAIYADREGHIGYFYNARAPRRVEGPDWRAYLPGDRPELVWEDHLSFDELPHVIDPKSGFVFSANHSAFASTVGPENPEPLDFPLSAGFDTFMTNRGRRALTLLGDDRPISRDRLMKVKYDKVFDDSSVAADVRRKVLASEQCQPGGASAEACKVLRDWDLSTDVESRGAALALLTAWPSMKVARQAHLDGDPLPDPLPAFEAAIETLGTQHGRLDPRWGDLNRLKRGELNLEVGGGPDVLRAIYSDGELERGQMSGIQGDSLVMLVEWGPEGELRSSSVHQFGSATLDKASPHYGDQAPLFVSEEMKSVILDEGLLRKKATRIYRPQTVTSAD